MNDDFEYTKGYRKIAAAEELQVQNDLLDLYLRLYRERYKQEFIVPVDKKHFKHIKDLREAVGNERALGIIYAFFEVRDSWFEKQHHSLECLLKNINKLSQYVAHLQRKQKLNGKLCIEMRCDACGNAFERILDPNHNFDEIFRCADCMDENKPLYKPSQEERLGALHMINATFKEVPKCS